MTDHNQRLVFAQPVHLRHLRPKNLRGRVGFPSLSVVRLRGGFRGAPGQEQHAFIPQRGIHPAESLVQDDEIWFLDDSAEEERHPLGGEGGVGEADFVGPLDWGVYIEY